MRIGAQMYTTRGTCQTLEGFADTLKRIADIGYRYVQVSGTCPYEGQWLKDELDKNGLTCVLTHIPVPRLENELDQVIADHDIFGCRNVGLGWWAFDDNPETGKGMTWDKWMETFPSIADRLHAAGKYFMYHNHDQEFKRLGGKVILEKLAETVPAEKMGFTLDTFWVQAGGGDPAQWLEKLSGRIPCIHLKDYAYGRSMAVVGEGNINWGRVFEKAEQGGTEYMLVEQDDCHGEDPIECLRRSYQYLTACGFE
ncbi:MAG: sugar phosphate isomerase/epimerase [Clostridia bacterium]|nr:sugar phosphate isomerase/epimerase [Clostridia bacterium]